MKISHLSLLIIDLSLSKFLDDSLADSALSRRGATSNALNEIRTSTELSNIVGIFIDPNCLRKDNKEFRFWSKFSVNFDYIHVIPAHSANSPIKKGFLTSFSILITLKVVLKFSRKLIQLRFGYPTSDSWESINRNSAGDSIRTCI